jgi:hypothetical protein
LKAYDSQSISQIDPPLNVDVRVQWARERVVDKMVHPRIARSIEFRPLWADQKYRSSCQRRRLSFEILLSQIDPPLNVDVRVQWARERVVDKMVPRRSRNLIISHWGRLEAVTNRKAAESRQIFTITPV